MTKLIRENQYIVMSALGTDCALESLEHRLLLAGVTLVTHGRQSGYDAEPWVQTMADSIATIAGPQTPVYKLKITVDQFGDPYVADFSLVEGANPASNANDSGEVVFILDWAGASGVVLDYNRTDTIASMVAPYFLNSFPSEGIDHPLAELPIHLIGHSRGGSVVAELARDLGEEGVWVDHLTTLDPHPVSVFADDPEISLAENIFFADNYYQTAALLLYGEFVAGAANYNLTDSGRSHEGIHEFYQESIDIPGSGTGYDFSLLRGGQRHLYGISKYFGNAGGSGERVSVSRQGLQWPDIGGLTIRDADGIITRGQPLPVHFLFQDADSAVTINFFLDTDRNPYNNSVYPIGSQSWQSTGNSILYWDTSANSTAKAPAGRFNLLAQITDGSGHARYAYADSTITLRNPIPSISSLTAKPKTVVKPVSFVLTANGVAMGISAVQQVAFFWDSNRNGRYDTTDTLLGRDRSAIGGWHITVNTRRLRNGSYRFFAFAFDGASWSNPRSVSVRIRT